MFKVKIKNLLFQKGHSVNDLIERIHLKYELKIIASGCINGILQRVHVGLVKLACVNT